MTVSVVRPGCEPVTALAARSPTAEVSRGRFVDDLPLVVGAKRDIVEIDGDGRRRFVAVAVDQGIDEHVGGIGRDVVGGRPCRCSCRLQAASACRAQPVICVPTPPETRRRDIAVRSPHAGNGRTVGSQLIVSKNTGCSDRQQCAFIDAARIGHGGGFVVDDVDGDRSGNGVTIVVLRRVGEGLDAGERVGAVVGIRAVDRSDQRVGIAAVAGQFELAVLRSRC